VARALDELAEVLHDLLLVGGVAHDVELGLDHLGHEVAEPLHELELLARRLEATRLRLLEQLLALRDLVLQDVLPEVGVVDVDGGVRVLRDEGALHTRGTLEME